jgi:hypothetical protein
VTTAIFGLVGVVVGAVVTGVVDLFVARQGRRASVFLARRLVGEELQTIWMHLDGLIASGHTPRTESDERIARYMPTVAWEAHKETLAVKGALTDDEWIYVSSILHAVASLRLVILEQPPASTISADLRSKAEEQRGLVADVYETLTGADLDMEPSG